MFDVDWTQGEKKLARRVFDVACAAELDEVLTDFKARAAAAGDTDDMWRLLESLSRKRRELEQKYDYRYSQLPLVFARLLREGRIQDAQLGGLAEEKLSLIRRIAAP